MTGIYLGLGSNLGNREAAVQHALALLDANGVHPIRASSLYESEPVGYLDQPWFVNMAVEVETAHPPLDLLRICQGIEHELGRERLFINGPRTIDIDILFYGDLTLATDKLTIPHPRIFERRFVLAPLAELDPVRFSRPLANISGQPIRILRSNT